jgi:hypothetical protein
VRTTVLPIIVAVGLEILVAVGIVTLLCALKVLHALDGMTDLHPGETDEVVDDRPLPLAFVFYGYTTLALGIGYSPKINLKGAGSDLFWFLWVVALVVSGVLAILVLVQPLWSKETQQRIRDHLRNYVVPTAFTLTMLGLALNAVMTIVTTLDWKGQIFFYLGFGLFVVVLVQLLRTAPPLFRDAFVNPGFPLLIGLGIYKILVSHNAYDGLAYVLLIPVILLLAAMPALLGSVGRRIEVFFKNRKAG